jgi:uncharacterized membrane protein
MKKILKKYWVEILLGLMTLSYIAYFSIYTILRYQTLWAHYFDLGIMNQTVYNTYRAIATGDYSRFLELTNPHGFDQVKRMAVHNDVFLAFLAPFYFIYSGPETLLVIQSIAVGLGAIAVYGIGNIVFERIPKMKLLSLLFSFAYLMYPALERANQFDFHAVVLATPLLLFMYYFYLKKRYVISSLFALSALLTKEEVGLTIAFFGLYVLFQNILPKLVNYKKTKHQIHVHKWECIFSLILIGIGTGWFIVSMTKIIPYFRSGAHFALEYFGDFGDSPKEVFLGLIGKPIVLFQHLFRRDTYEYVYNILGPLGFLSALSPLHLLIATPELAINLLSKSGAMRNIYFHYTAVITPFVFISALYGFKFLLQLSKSIKYNMQIIITLFLICILYFSITLSPLPYALNPEVHPFIWPVKERNDARQWGIKLADENIKVMATGHIAPLFSSRRYFYIFSAKYDLADYIVLSTDEVYNSNDGESWKPAYERLIVDANYFRIYKNKNFEVYKKI